MAGRKMARFILEDLHGNVSVTCFPRTYERYRELIEDDSIVVCQAKVEDRAEEPALILDEVYSVEQALQRFDGGILIRVEPGDRPNLARLREVVASHKGKNRLYLQVVGEDGSLRRVRVPATSGVSISAEFAEEVDELLGRGRVQLARM